MSFGKERGRKNPTRCEVQENTKRDASVVVRLVKFSFTIIYYFTTSSSHHPIYFHAIKSLSTGLESYNTVPWGLYMPMSAGRARLEFNSRLTAVGACGMHSTSQTLPYEGWTGLASTNGICVVEKLKHRFARCCEKRGPDVSFFTVACTTEKMKPANREHHLHHVTHAMDLTKSCELLLENNGFRLC